MRNCRVVLATILFVVSLSEAQFPNLLPAKMPNLLPSRLPPLLPARLPSQLPAQLPAKLPAQLPVQLPIQLPAQLRNNFYAQKCPQAEFIVAKVFAKNFAKNPGFAAGLIRIFFHDCFVTGCDASLLLDSTPSGETVEKLTVANGGGLNGLNGLGVIDEIKAQLEKECPKTVSCSDLIAYAARESVVLSGLPSFPVQGGRRDSLTSRVTDVSVSLPFPTISVDNMIRLYTNRGLTVEDMVALAGAHSIGNVHCNMFDHRLYLNFTTVPVSPIDPVYAKFLKSKCPSPNGGNQKLREVAMVNFEPVTPLKLDNLFYKSLQQSRGLLQSDQVLLADPRTSKLVQTMALDPEGWGRSFVNAMIKLGKVNVLTGTQGTIRRNCRIPVPK